MVYVLDTSAILSGKFFGSDIVTTPKILEEIKPKGHSWRLLEYMKSIGMKVMQPPEDAIKEVIEAARKTGDIANLSGADIEALALAYHLKATLLTDDYSMQNVAKELHIEYRSVVEEGIKEKFYWEFRCKSCGRFFENYQKICPVCGGEVKRTIRKN
jgi:UPF0271 protein